MARLPPQPPPVPTARHSRRELRIRLPARRRVVAEGRGRWKEKRGEGKGDTYDDGDGGGSAEDLLDQAVAVVKRLHDLPLALGDLQKGKSARVSPVFASKQHKGLLCD